MTLNDLRRAAIKRQLRLQFKLSNGMTCVVDEHGIARVGELRGPSSLNLEQELAASSSFATQAAGTANVRQCTRAELESLVGQNPSPGTDHDHDE